MKIQGIKGLYEKISFIRQAKRWKNNLWGSPDDEFYCLCPNNAMHT